MESLREGKINIIEVYKILKELIKIKKNTLFVLSNKPKRVLTNSLSEEPEEMNSELPLYQVGNKNVNSNY